MTKMLEIEEKKERSKLKKKDKKWWLFEIVMLCLIVTDFSFTKGKMKAGILLGVTTFNLGKVCFSPPPTLDTLLLLSHWGGR